MCSYHKMRVRLFQWLIRSLEYTKVEMVPYVFKSKELLDRTFSFYIIFFLTSFSRVLFILFALSFSQCLETGRSNNCTGAHEYHLRYLVSNSWFNRCPDTDVIFISQGLPLTSHWNSYILLNLE